ncbi:30S ribosomal protein S4 [Flexilinea flocculi]|uniref:Small ribosomal subunit protein uS4 n=1 Tax=Flexilinea flocculi TaxID=1678840 RepID=A0A0K8PAW2_9CHLR|nr:30S ribosomal protein S4 [Flexilinea flocculi]GAP39802.1 SSU ribosomal protein S4P [Flexilinea flocculi]
MARYTGSACKLCRRENVKLFLKGERCYTPKCSFEKRAYAPGDHGKTGSSRGGGERVSDYSRQLRAKQRVRRVYGVLERQFSRVYGIAEKTPGITGLNLLQLLETRLDNVVYRLGFADNRASARQMVNHGHFMVNGIHVDIPSMILKPGDQIAIREVSKKRKMFQDFADYAEKRNCALWLDRDVKALSGRVLRLPERSEIDGDITEQLIVEYYSR